MTRWLRVVAIGALAAVALAMIGLQAASPQLYSGDRDAVTLFHTNPAYEKPVSPDQASSVLPTMGDLLDIRGTLLLDIRFKDFDLAEQDLREYLELTRNMDNLVINLDMGDTDIANFSKMNREDLSTLAELINSTSRFEELQHLEVRYRDENNPTQLYAVVVEGEAIRTKSWALLNRYRGNEEPQTTVGQKYEQNTTRYEQSVDDFTTIVEGMIGEQADRRREFENVLTPNETISISAGPGEVAYRDTLRISGNLSGPDPAGRTVGIFVDSEEIVALDTDPHGVFRYDFPIDRIASGNHTVFAALGKSAYSEGVPFYVKSLPTTLSLAAFQNGSMVEYNGSLRADGRPVTDAPVELLVDGTTGQTALTDAGGEYTARFSPGEGRHRFLTRFSSGGYPLGSSESEPVVLTVRNEDNGMYSLVSAFAALTGSVGAAALYLRRKRPKPPDASGPHPQAAGTASQFPALPDPELAFLDRAKDDLSGAARQLYRTLVLLFSWRYPLKHPSSRTPREFCGTTGTYPFNEQVKRFVTRYEPVRYGGAGEGEEELLAAYRDARDGIEGEQP
ncbi:MAG: hypothetical protein LUO88_00240 [Methanoregulaceae archaeon]|nr:hypothetical protein [Methanoregulaceae archaeon]